MKDYMCGQWL